MLLSAGQTLALGTELLLFIGVPPLCAVLLCRRLRVGAAPALIGAGTFVLFALLLERAAHALMLSSAAGAFLRASPWRYACYAGLMAGLFEEGGRLAAFAVFRRRITGREDALCAGVGHGGMECLLLGLSVLVSWIVSPLSFLTVTWADCLIAVWERAFALIAHASLSVLVFSAVQHKKWLLFPLAVLLHAALDVPAALYQAGGPVTLLGAELAGTAAALAAAGCAAAVYRLLPRAQKNAAIRGAQDA